jgi:hypothetical protein
MTAAVKPEEGVAEFRMKSIFYQGTAEGGPKVVDKGEEGKWENHGPMQGAIWFAHKLYTKLWMESALGTVKR